MDSWVELNKQMNTIEIAYETKSAVLFIIFNRLDTSLLVFEQIRKAKPSKLYITADFARADRPDELINCNETKKVILSKIDWNCEVKTLFQTSNVGPKETITSAIDWFFENEEEGIILEHDCLPSNSFFYYCDCLLETYRNDNRIWLISGFNFKTDKKWGDATYYFSNLTNGWGWATWRRSWASYDKNLSKYDASEVRVQLEKIFDNKLIVDRWVEIFNDTKSGKIDTWDYQVTFAHLFSHTLTIVPNYNLVSNIGFGAHAENTTNINSPFAEVELEEISEIIHPKYMIAEKQADEITLMEEFNTEDRIKYLKKHHSYRRQFKRWLKKILSSE